MSIFPALVSAAMRADSEEPMIRICCATEWERKIIRQHLKVAHEECALEQERRDLFEKHWSSLTEEQKRTITSVAEGMVTQR